MNAKWGACLLVLWAWLRVLPGAAATLSDEVRVSAASATASGAAACRAVQPFYWEIGDARGPVGSGRLGDGAPERDAALRIASASKWIYAAYVAERRAGHLTDEDVRDLTFTSGYTHFRFCRAGQTVAECMDALINGFGRQERQDVGFFSYGGGHMQHHAMSLALGGLDRAALGEEVTRGLPALGAGWHFAYAQPQPAGGGVASAATYARFLQALAGQQLKLSGLLGSHAVCTNPKTCPREARRTPVPADETWHYSIGHWVEDDPSVGDGAFSSPGAFGFYPWLTADRRWYGLVAREDHDGLIFSEPAEKPGVQSALCGRLLRAAFADGRPRS